MSLEPFAKSEALTFGVELELQLVNRHDYDLASASSDLLRMLKGKEHPGDIKPEITEAMIEIATGICHSHDEALWQLREIRDRMVEAAVPLNIGICGGGTHPFQQWSQRTISASPRYQYLSELYGYLAKQFTVFGQHVHLGCPSPDDALYLLHAMSRYVPHFIALAAASPFVQGVDTGFASARLNSVSAFPMSGRAPFVLTWDAFVAYFEKMRATGVIESMKDFYWDIRPKPEFGTIEVRVMDTPLTVERAAAEARVAPDDIRTLAQMYAAASPAVLRCGWGLERNRNGGQAAAAILALPALLGKFGLRGGGYTMSNSGAAKLDLKKVFGDYSWRTRVLNMTQLGALLNGELEPPIKALYVYNCNPAATVPDQNAVLQGLAREDLFTVVHEQVMTDTAKYADVILPAPTFLEQREIKKAYGSYVVGGVQPAIPARGEAKPNEEVFAALGRALGWRDQPFSWDTSTCMRKVAGALTLAGRPADAALFEAGESQRFDFPGPAPVQFQTVFPQTPDGKIHLTPAALGAEPFRYQPIGVEKFPLALVSSATSKMITSTLGEFNYPELRVTLNPQDAAARSIAEGDPVRVFNQLGEVVCRADLSDRLREGVVVIPKGAWRKSSRNGRTATALCPATISQVGGGACYNDARVEVEKI